MVDVHVYSDQPSASRAAREALTMILREAMGKSVLLLVSGGSSLEVLKELPDDIFDGQMTLGVIDERFAFDPKINNFLQLKDTDFFKKATSRGLAYIETVPKVNETVEEMAKRYEENLKEWRIGHQDGEIITLLGIGKDGHIAGIMAYPDDLRGFQYLFEDEDVWVTGYDAGTRNQYPIRVTTTLPFLRKLDTAVVYAVGEAKKPALTAVLSPEGMVHKTPGRIIHEMKHCLLYTDQSVDTVKK